MNFTSQFLRILLSRPQDALSALYWWVTGRRVRARNRLHMAASQSPSAYKVWMETIERSSDAVAVSPAAVAGWTGSPRISLLGLLPSPHSLDGAIRSLLAQRYSKWELVVVDSAGGGLPRQFNDSRIRLTPEHASDAAHALDLAIRNATGDLVVPLPSSTVLPPTALHHYAAAYQAVPAATAWYGDHDELDAEGTRQNPWFKPRWNEEMFLAQDYLSAAVAVRRDAALMVPPAEFDHAAAEVYALLLALSRKPEAVFVHIPHILAHTRNTLGPENVAGRLTSVGQHVSANRATVRPGPFGTVAVSWPLPEELPQVSIIIPTRDNLHLLRNCVRGVLAATDYTKREILIVDNGSVEPSTLAYLDEIQAYPLVRVLRYHAPFNYSAINNFAAAHASGEYLCLLNDDTEVIDASWLTEMMRQAVRPQVGAVGAKLLYDDGTIQHAGVVLGMSEAARHAHRFENADQPGYFHRTHVSHFVSAVTAACLVVKKDKFDGVGGLDSKWLAIAFNDVDLCLKLQQAGFRNVFEPRAVLIHHESRSRGSDIATGQIERYRCELTVLQERWATRSIVDPLHHPVLDRASDIFLLKV